MHAGGEELVFITTEVVDKDGNASPVAQNEITFESMKTDHSLAPEMGIHFHLSLSKVAHKASGPEKRY